MVHLQRWGRGFQTRMCVVFMCTLFCISGVLLFFTHSFVPVAVAILLYLLHDNKGSIQFQLKWFVV